MPTVILVDFLRPCNTAGGSSVSKTPSSSSTATSSSAQGTGLRFRHSIQTSALLGNYNLVPPYLLHPPALPLNLGLYLSSVHLLAHLHLSHWSTLVCRGDGVNDLPFWGPLHHSIWGWVPNILDLVLALHPIVPNIHNAPLT